MIDQFLPKDSEMGQLIRQHDWSNSPLGPMDTWDVSLRTTLGIVLHSAFPMFLFWGEDLICFYNDAYRPSLGIDGKHPAIGKTAKETWSEIWDFVGPLIEKVMTTGQPFFFKDQLVSFYRNGGMEDIYWTFCHSAAFDDQGKINGVLVTCSETTESVLTKRKLEESERRLRSMIAQAPVSIGIFQGSDHITEIANAKALELWGRSSEEILHIPILDAMPELESQGIKILLDEVYTTGKIFRAAELPVQIKRNGNLENTYVNFSYEPLYNTNGEIDGIMAVGIDVTDQVNARHEIRDSEARFRAIADNIPNLAWMAKADGWIYWYNKKWYDYTGKTPEEMEGWGWQSVHDPEVLKTVIPKWQHSIEQGETFEMVFPLLGKDGNYRQFLTRVLPLFDEEGKISNWFGSNTDITELMEAQQSVAASEQRFSNILSQSLLAVCILKGEEMIIASANDAIIEIWGKGPDVLNKPLLEVLPELKTQVIPKLLQEVYSTGVPFISPEIKVTFVRDGKPEESYFNVVYQAYRETDQSISGITVFASEITEQVIAKRQLEESEKKFRLLADSMPQYIWTADPQGNLNYFNQSVYDFSGLTPEQIATDGWLQIVHPEERERNIASWIESVTTGKDYRMEHRFRRHDGSYRWQLSRAKPQWDEDGNIQMWVGTSTDIQDQKDFASELERQVKERTAELVQMNENLKKSEQRYHLMVEEVQDYAILYINREGIVENWNTGAQKIKGYTAKEIIGRSFSNFYTQGDRERGLPQILLNTALQFGKATQEGWRVKKDGSLFWASVVITAVHNDRREIIGFSKVTHDLTEKKEASDALNAKTVELEEKNAELQRMNKELQSFAYISSHDLQEPLRKIQTFASRIVEKEHENLSDKGRDLFARMQRSAEQMQALINDLLAYSRTNTAEHVYQKVNLATVIDKIKQDLSEELEEKNAEIIVQNPVEVNVIHFQFHQLFYNLISNSIKFSHPDRALHLSITTEKVNESNLPTKNLPQDKDYWHISIRDNGIGFESEYNERIFGLFQRLHGKSEYKGTGIGLSIVKKIAENHNGLITAKGEIGKGATFDIYLPVERG
ncbi:hypothetical protein GCM10009119_18000 [Algoriphagus jejuensis]|uniref:histidine kinase n=1 Tax=Algoriphagus jejuensis TaxID=419934 RepID=A0ABN1MZ77_9BACT